MAVAVWSISCFFIAKPFRGKGLSTSVIAAATQFALEHGARIVEAYPVEPKKVSMPAVFAWTGFVSAFIAAGFWELWNVAIPLAPVVLIMVGIGLLLWYFTRKLNGRKRMF